MQSMIVTLAAFAVFHHLEHVLYSTACLSFRR